MVATESQIRHWLNDPASGPSVYRRAWADICQALMWQICNRFGSAPVVYSTATAAANASGYLNPDIRSAPRGSFHYWNYTATIRGTRQNYGHVGLDTRGGGVGVMSTGRGEQWANGAGLIDFGLWSSQMGSAARYRGWARTNGRNTVTINTEGSPSGSKDMDSDMPLDSNTDYPAFRDMLWRALKYDIRPNAAGADWRNGPTLFERFDSIDREILRGFLEQKYVMDGKPIPAGAIGNPEEYSRLLGRYLAAFEAGKLFPAVSLSEEVVREAIESALGGISVDAGLSPAQISDIATAVRQKLRDEPLG